jgi:hypothetical protein
LRQKEIARMGHPAPGTGGAVEVAHFLGDFGSGLRGFVVSHPCDKKKSQGWGTQPFQSRMP